MAGRPQRRPTPASRKGRAPHPVAPPAEPLTRQGTAAPHGIMREGEERALLGKYTRSARPIADAYAAVAGADLSFDDASDADSARRSYFKQVSKNGKTVTGAQAIAGALFTGIVSGGRIAVAAAKEIADRTEGPVVQRVESLSARFVVSVGPTGALGALPASPGTPEDWEAAVRADLGAREAEARLAAPASAGDGEPASDNASFVKSTLMHK